MTTVIQLLFLPILMLCGCESNTGRADNLDVEFRREFYDGVSISETIAINGVENIEVNGEGKWTLDQLSDFINQAASKVKTPENQFIIKLSVSEDVPIGYVKKIKKLIQKHSSKILVIYGNGYGEGKIVRLPPLTNDRPDYTKLRKRNVLKVVLDSTGTIDLSPNDKESGMVDPLTNLKERTKIFLVSDTLNEDLPVLSNKNVPYFGEVMTASSAIILLISDDVVEYKRYEQVYYTILNVYEELWNNLAKTQFNNTYEDIDRSKKEAIRMIYPQVIGEIDI